MESALFVCRFLHFSSAMVLFGALLLRFAIGKHDNNPSLETFDAWFRKASIFASILMLGSAVAWLLVETASMSGSWKAAVDGDALSTVAFGTEFGQIWMGRLLALTGLLAVVVAGRDRLEHVKLAISLVVLGSLGLVGHAAMDDGWTGVLHRINHGLHLLSAGVWVGGIAMLAVLFIQAHRSGRGATALLAASTFSAMGVYTAALVVLTGALNSWLLLTDLSDFTHTQYGQILATKIMLVVAMLVFATVHRSVLLPAAIERGYPDRTFVLSMCLDLAITVIVLAVVSVLGTHAPAL